MTFRPRYIRKVTIFRGFITCNEFFLFKIPETKVCPAKLNQTKVATHCKVKFQQLQKYEKGINGCSAYRLHQLAKFFKVGLDVLVDPDMITKHRGFASYQDQIDSDIEIDKLLSEQEIIENYKQSVGHKCP